MITVDVQIKIPETTKRILARLMDKRRIMTPFKEALGESMKDYAELCRGIMQKNIKVKKEKYKKITRAIRATKPVVMGNEVHCHYSDIRSLRRITAKDSDIPLVTILEGGHKAFTQSQGSPMAVEWGNITPWRRIYKPKSLTKKEQGEEKIIRRSFYHKAYKGIKMFEKTNKAIRSLLPKRIENMLREIITTGRVTSPRMKITTAKI